MARQDTDKEVLKRTGMQSVHTLLKMAQLRWTGHVTRMPDESLPKKTLYGELHRWSEEAIQGHPQSLLYRLEHTNREVGLANTKQKEKAKPSRNVHIGKPELKHHQRRFLPQTSLVLSATGSLELRLVSSAILEHTNNNTSHI